jgi:hypothetical protein
MMSDWILNNFVICDECSTGISLLEFENVSGWSTRG